MRRVIGFALLIFLLTACSNSGQAPKSQVAEPEPGLTTIRLAVHADAEDPVLDSIIAAFQSQNPQYRVEKVPVPTDGTNQGMGRDMAMAGEVDVLSAYTVRVDQYRLALRPLDGFLAQGGLDQSRFGTLLEEMKVDGRAMVLPYVVNPSVFVYNTKMAKAAGVTIPKDQWTWDEFRLALQKLTHGQGAEKVWGLDTTFPEDLVHIYLHEKYQLPLWQAGHGALKDALGFFNTLAFTDQSMVPLPKESITASGSRSRFSWHLLESLNAQKAAMTYEPGLGLTWALKNAQVDWDVAPMPSFPGAKPVLRVWTRALGVAAETPRPEAAWKFVAFAVGPEGAEIVARTGQIPGYFTPQTEEFLAQYKYPDGVKSIWNATWKTQVMPPSPNGYGHRHIEAHKAMYAALAGTKSLEDAIGYFKDLP